ncbi:coiled-coil domain-containing protein 27 isoform X4 [Columba livia]|uniref:coiled-coil domain-containing protein 27 isoform X4 n=1 Tax=Columba livia TaxID=8932 RepID=UPI0031BB8B11
MEGSREAPGEALGDADARRASQELQEPEPELREQLQRARAEYSMATGVISSLQRQLEIQESQLRRIQSEKEMLQRKLREREHQLQGLSAKFCSLTEEQEDKEMMVTIEKENCNLRQVVAEQESKLAEQRQLISELQEAVGQLQEEVRSSRHRLRQQRQARDAAQSQAEALQHQELQTRVALECLTSRFERYRNKIIQATFSTAGMKAPQAELTDEEVLEAMQKIISERMDFYHLLKQRGIKTPSLPSIDTSTLMPPSSKGRRKSPAR